MSLKAPFPWFGGKSRVSDIVWDHFGDVDNYVEPFFHSAGAYSSTSIVMSSRTAELHQALKTTIDRFPQRATLRLRGR